MCIHTTQELAVLGVAHFYPLFAAVQELWPRGLMHTDLLACVLDLTDFLLLPALGVSGRRGVRRFGARRLFQTLLDGVEE